LILKRNIANLKLKIKHSIDPEEETSKISIKSPNRRAIINQMQILEGNDASPSKSLIRQPGSTE